MSRRKATPAVSDEAVALLLHELRLTAGAWEADRDYEGTVTLSAAAAHALLANYDRTVGPTRKYKARVKAKIERHQQPAAKVKARRIGVLTRELRLAPDQALDADTLRAARAILAKHGMRQDNDTRLREEIRAALT